MPQLPVWPVCSDNANGNKDRFGHDCQFFTRFPGMCGLFDDNGFDSETLCCACGGGSDTTDTIDIPHYDALEPFSGTTPYTTPYCRESVFCKDMTTNSSCIAATNDCVYDDGQCRDKTCSDFTDQSSCDGVQISGDTCFWGANVNVCHVRTDCQLHSAEECNTYPGCIKNHEDSCVTLHGNQVLVGDVDCTVNDWFNSATNNDGTQDGHSVFSVYIKECRMYYTGFDKNSTSGEVLSIQLSFG